MKLQFPQQIKPTLTLVQLNVVLKVGTAIIYYCFKICFVPKDTEFNMKWCIKTEAMPYKCDSQ